jgi:hypothetical protein
VPVSHSSGGTSALLHTASGSAPIPVSLPISASALANTSRALSTSAAFSVIPIGLSGQGLYPQYKNPPPQMKPIVVGPASTTVTPISLHTTALAHQQTATVSVTPPPAKQQQQPPIVLPSLTDDMFVVEAPSFIVPYVYEKPPMKALKEHLEKIQTEIKEALAKEKEEEAARETEKRIEEEREAQQKKDEEKDDEEKEKESENEKMEVDEPGEATKESVSAAEVEPEKTENDGKADEKKESGDDEQTSAEKSEKAEPAVETNAEESDGTKTAEDGKTLDLTATTLEKKDDAVEKKDEQQQQTPQPAAKDDKKSPTNAADDAKKPLSFFDNPLGKFFIQIGLNLVQEHVQTDLLRSQRRKRDKEGENCSPEVLATISELTRTLESSKENNDPFKLDMKKCELCSFRTESLLAMAHHLETPHMKNYTYRCNFCPLEVRSPHDILFHMEAEHNVRGRLERAPAFHQCPNCPFEDNQKGKLTRHMVSCSKKYRPEKNQVRFYNVGRTVQYIEFC